MIRMGAIEPTVSLILSSVIIPFLEKSPQVQFELEVGNTNNISDRVAKGELDFAICSTPAADANLLFTQWAEETLVVLMPEHHPLTKKEVIHITDIQSERLLFPGQNSACRSVLETHLMKNGKSLYSSIAIGSTEVLKKAVKQHLGLAIVPLISADPGSHGTVLRKIDDIPLRYPIGLVQRKKQMAGSLHTKLLDALRMEMTSWRIPY